MGARQGCFAGAVAFVAVHLPVAGKGTLSALCHRGREWLVAWESNSRRRVAR
jgi:hypothetical protein